MWVTQWRVVAARTIAALALVVVGGHAVSMLAQSRLAVIDPRDGREVGATVEATGTAHLTAGEHVWVLVHRTKGFKDVWWPQGEGEVDPRTSEWTVSVSFGQPADIGYEFEVAAVTVAEKEHSRLKAYLDHAMETGDWRAIQMPATTSPPVLRTVRKVSHR